MCGCDGKPSTIWRGSGIASDNGPAGGPTPRTPRSRRRLPEGVSHFALAKINTAIPDIEPLLFPLLGLAGDDHAHRLRDAVDLLADRPGHTDGREAHAANS